MAKIYRTSSSPPPTLESTKAAQDAPHAHSAADADESAPRDYDLPVCSRMVIPEDYKRDDGDDDKDEKFEGGGGVDSPPAPGRWAQTGTPDPSAVGNTKRPLSADMLHDLAEPTLLVPAPEGPQPSPSTMTTTTILRGFPFVRIKITLVATSSTPCHSLAVCVRVRAYSWGRNK